MGLLKVKVSQDFHSNRFLEKVFYRQFPATRKIPFSKFLSVSRTARLLFMPVASLPEYITQSKVVHAIQVNDTIYVHPVAPYAVLRRKFRHLTKALKACPTS